MLLLSICSNSGCSFDYVKIIRMICIDCVIVGLISIEFRHKLSWDGTSNPLILEAKWSLLVLLDLTNHQPFLAILVIVSFTPCTFKLSLSLFLKRITLWRILLINPIRKGLAGIAAKCLIESSTKFRCSIVLWRYTTSYDCWWGVGFVCGENTISRLHGNLADSLVR